MTGRASRRGEGGFTLIDMIAVLALISTMAAIAIPELNDTVSRMRLGMATRSVERELEWARLKAVSTNRPMRVHFDCPAAAELRVVELIGTPSAPDPKDTAADRCDETKYPYSYAGGDQNPLTRPNNDGPVRYLEQGVTFAASQTLEFWPDGSVHADAGVGTPWPPVASPGATITLSAARYNQTKNITVNGLGKIQMDR
jgi:Tfp pilus assembly protein FimT